MLSAALALASSFGAWAEPRSLPLDPAHAEIGFRAYAFGMIPVDGTFSRFSGALTIDPAAPGACRVNVRVDVASLHMPDPAIRDDVLSANLLDAADFPTLIYDGACRGDVIDGTLTLHGTSRPLRLAIENAPARYTAEASLRRRDWGIAGRPLMAGATVRIRVSTTISR
jgi:polyisoprenoid-binding protein YceI